VGEEVGGFADLLSQDLDTAGLACMLDLPLLEVSPTGLGP